MRISFILLAATAVTFIASGNALASDFDKVAISTMTSSDHVQSIDAAQNNNAGKRFLRRRKTHHEDDEEDEERGTGAKMLSSETFKKEMFQKWLDANKSSYTVFVDIFKEKEKYRGLYNDYAAFRKAANPYP
uniref:RxLR effector protein n=1 Tax=Phytophthora agathidicida TaxID=1642459 RepID=A0A7G4WHZ4_9STRA|nr:PaRXLR5 [Phytophthora agathidicida]